MENITFFILLKKSKEFINSFVVSDVLKKINRNLHLKLWKFYKKNFQICSKYFKNI